MTIEFTDWASDILNRAQVAAVRFNPDARIRLARTAAGVEAVLTDEPGPTDQPVLVGDMTLYVEAELEGLVDCREPHDELVLRPLGSSQRSRGALMLPDLGTLLVVGAHPDDETFTAGGLMARGVIEGHRVVCVTATRGEGGSLDPERWPPEQMGVVREKELRACLDVLGVEEHHWLDYIDGTCHEVDADEGTAKVRRFMEEVQPDSVLTFGPDGMTGHPDHKAVSDWTTAAFLAAAKPGARLYYATQTPEWAEIYLPLMEPFNVFGPGTPPITPVEELAIHFPLPDDLRQRKARAIEQQISQVERMVSAFGRQFFTEGLGEEAFVRAPVAGPGT
jgi:LmbE family N-acetylglucosaminyl deacetylase